MLTPKQEKFCQCIVSGMSGKDSYYAAYDTKCNDKTAYSEAIRLLSRDDVMKRLEELRLPLENHAKTQALADRDTKREWLWSIINDPNKDDNNRLRAMDILCKVDAEYTNISVNHNESTLSLKDLDITTLKTLSE